MANGDGRTDDTVDLIDVGPLVRDPLLTGEPARAVAAHIDAACRSLGFFRITGHEVPTDLLGRLDAAARAFFALAREDKAEFAMDRGGRRLARVVPRRRRDHLWSARPQRGPLRRRGAPGRPPARPRPPPVARGEPLPSRTPLGPLVLEWLAAMRQLADRHDASDRRRARPAGRLVRAAPHGRSDPAVPHLPLPRPPRQRDPDEYGVGEHTDYGLLTLLAQDDIGGLEVRTPTVDGSASPPIPGARVQHRRHARPDHRGPLPLDAAPRAEHERDGPAVVPVLLRSLVGRDRGPAPPRRFTPADDSQRRWDGASVHAWTGTYGDYLTAKVAKVFPDLFASSVVGQGPEPN